MIGAALETRADDFVRLNVSQLQDSKRSDDATITPPYSRGYAAVKGFRDPNLKLTGDFHEAIFFATDGDTFFLSSTDPKMPMLVDRYSDAIFGIAPSRREDGKQVALEAVSKLYNEYVLNA